MLYYISVAFVFVGVDIDECSVRQVCHVNATCQNIYGSYSCSCKDGFFGDGKRCATSSGMYLTTKDAQIKQIPFVHTSGLLFYLFIFFHYRLLQILGHISLRHFCFLLDSCKEALQSNPAASDGPYQLTASFISVSSVEIVIVCQYIPLFVAKSIKNEIGQQRNVVDVERQ